MTPDERRDMARRMNDEVWNKGNVDILDEVIIVDGWIVYDLLGALQQLGVIPQMPRQETTS